MMATMKDHWIWISPRPDFRRASREGVGALRRLQAKRTSGFVEMQEITEKQKATMNSAVGIGNKSEGKRATVAGVVCAYWVDCVSVTSVYSSGLSEAYLKTVALEMRIPEGYFGTAHRGPCNQNG